MARPTNMSVQLSCDEARSLRELATDMDVAGDEVLRRALRLLGLVYGLHSSVHGVVRPVADPREAA
jgi:hypothetical protein